MEVDSMIIPDIYPELKDLLIKGSMQELLEWNNEIRVSGYQLNNLVNIKIALYLEEIAKRGVIVVGR